MMNLLKYITALICIMHVKGNCPNACSGHGDCGKTAICDCYGEWMGADCSLRVCSFGKAYIDSPYGDLDGDGKLSPSRAFSPTENFKVVSLNQVIGGVGEMSYTNYGYARKNTTIEWNEAHFYRECSNKGKCDRETGQCKCFPGFTGGACERIHCPKDCSGHGRCLTIRDSVGSQSYSAWDIDSTQVCKCDPGFEGPDCSLRTCPHGADPVKYSHTVTNSLHGIYWRTFAGDIKQTNSTAGKLKFLKDKPKTVYYTITYTDEYGDSWTTSMMSIQYVSFCTDAGYCFSTPYISANARKGGKKSKSDILVNTLKVHTETLNNTLSGLPKSAAPGHYVWSLANLFDATCDGVTSNPTGTRGSGTQTGSIQTKLNDPLIKNCAGSVKVVQTVNDNPTVDGYLVHPSANSKTNTQNKEIFVDALDYRLDEIAAEGCRYFEQPTTTPVNSQAWRRDANLVSFDGTATSVFGLCDFILLKDHGVAPALRVNYFHEPEGQIDGIPASPNSDPTQSASGSTVKFAAVKKQTTGALSLLEISRNEDIVVVQSLNSHRQWNAKDGDVTKQFISQSSQSLPQCSKRGVCNSATGKCNCFGGFNGLRCETRNAIAYSY